VRRSFTSFRMTEGRAFGMTEVRAFGMTEGRAFRIAEMRELNCFAEDSHPEGCRIPKGSGKANQGHSER